MHRTVRFTAWLALSLAPLALSMAGCAAQSEGEFCSTLNGNDDCEPGLVCRSSLCCPPQGRPSSVAACMTTTSGGTGGSSGSGGSSGAGGSAGSAGASGADAATEADAADETSSDAADESSSDAADGSPSDGAAD